jgi:Uncharacterized conserved protein
MAPIREKVVTAKAATVRDMLAAIQTLPLGSEQAFLEDPRMVAAGESFLRRALEALLDIGRHILAKSFGTPVAEYGEIGRRLGERGVLRPESAALLAQMGRYRNRLTHFYDEVTPEELFQLLSNRLGDIESILEEILGWLHAHPDLLDAAL